MKLITSPNDWSCMAAAAAMITDTSVAYIAHMLGHDGSDHPWPQPYNHWHRGFHIHEIIDLLWIQFQQSVTPFVRNPMGTPHPDCPEQPVKSPFATDNETRFTRAMWHEQGIITGTVNKIGHAVAWDGKLVYDPRGYRYQYINCPNYNFDPDVFWCVK